MFFKRKRVGVGTVLKGHYKLVKKIAATSFSHVYLGEQLSTSQPVAVKILHLRKGKKADRKALEARFKREMAAYARLKHPNIVNLIDFGQTDDSAEVFTVLEFIQGVSLAKLLKREKRLDPFEAKRLMLQVLDALSCGHAQDFVHRDLKPGNIMVTSTGVQRNVKLLDFGLAGISRNPFIKKKKDRITLPGEVPGTPIYMAPEQIEGDVTVQSDIYAWGLVYLEILTGHKMMAAPSDLQVLARHLLLDVQIPEPIGSHPLGAILRKATAKELVDRYEDALAAISELRTCPMSRLDTLNVDFPDPAEGVPELPDFKAAWKLRKARKKAIAEGRDPSTVPIPAASTPGDEADDDVNRPTQDTVIASGDSIVGAFSRLISPEEMEVFRELFSEYVDHRKRLRKDYHGNFRGFVRNLRKRQKHLSKQHGASEVTFKVVSTHSRVLIKPRVVVDD